MNEEERWYLPIISVWDHEDPLEKYRGLKAFGDYLQWNALQYVWYYQRFGNEIIELLLSFGANPKQRAISNFDLHHFDYKKWKFTYSPLKFLNLKKNKQYDIYFHYKT